MIANFEAPGITGEAADEQVRAFSADVLPHLREELKRDRRGRGRRERDSPGSTGGPHAAWDYSPPSKCARTSSPMAPTA